MRIIETQNLASLFLDEYAVDSMLINGAGRPNDLLKLKYPPTKLFTVNLVPVSDHLRRRLSYLRFL
jgi:hypothetical protein